MLSCRVDVPQAPPEIASGFQRVRRTRDMAELNDLRGYPVRMNHGLADSVAVVLRDLDTCRESRLYLVVNFVVQGTSRPEFSLLQSEFVLEQR